MKIETLQNCTGCSACNSICPKKAITMLNSKEGFLYPKITKQNCIECNLCEKVCPVITPLKKNESAITVAYAAINKDDTIRLDSSSGGIFTAIAQKVIDENGVVFGAKFADDFSVVHSWTDTIKGISDFRGSKYLQSFIGNTYKECKEFLEDGRKVLFSGTPCQIQGLKKYLDAVKCSNRQTNLITVDFICHGVPSPLLWKKYIEFREKKSASRIVKTSFRQKYNGWKQYNVSFSFLNDSKYCKVFYKDSYMKLFLKDVTLRKACYSCTCRGVIRNCDITLADFWGIQHILPDMDDDKGTSFIVAHSEKAYKLLSTLENCKLEKVNISDAIKFNLSMENSPIFPKKRVKFYDDLLKYPFKKNLKKYTITPFWLRLFNYAKKILKKK